MLFQYVPSGRVYAAPDYQTTMERGKPLFERASAAYADTLHQRHLAQVGFVDRLVGDLIARLRFANITTVVSAFGELRKAAEKVASEAASQIKRHLEAGVPVCEHLADQLLLPLALGKGGSFRTVKPPGKSVAVTWTLTVLPVKTVRAV